MRVLLLNMYYPPDTSATAKMIATVTTALSAAHDVTVLCGRPSYDPTERRPWRLWQSERVNEKLRVIRVGSTDYPRMRMNRRVLNYLTYVMLAVPRALPISCDVVLTMTDPPFAGIVGAFVALLKGKPYVYNIRDLYPDMATGGSIVAPGFLSRAVGKIAPLGVAPRLSRDRARRRYARAHHRERRGPKTSADRSRRRRRHSRRIAAAAA